jgi:hypothetical protein
MAATQPELAVLVVSAICALMVLAKALVTPL